MSMVCPRLYAFDASTFINQTKIADENKIVIFSLRSRGQCCYMILYCFTAIACNFESDEW